MTLATFTARLYSLRSRPADAEYALAVSLPMTLRRLKLYATLIPIVAVVVLEAVRYALMGRVPVTQRLILDAVSVAGIVLFSSIIFRLIEQMQQKLKRQNEELLALHRAGLAVAAELSLDSVLNTVVEQARVLVGAKYGALSVVDRDGRIQQFITSGVSAEERAAIGPPPVGHGVLGVVLREGRHLRLENVQRHPGSSGFPPNHPVMRTLLAVPIECKSPFLGNLYLSEKNDGSMFTDHDEETLERFAVQAAIAIDNAHLHAQSADLAVAQERVRIAHEMHDGLAQVLGYVNTKVQAADAYLKRGKTEEASAQMRELAIAARSAYTDVREGIVGLRTLPEAERPMAEVLREFLERWQEQSGIQTQLTMQGELRLRPAIELQLVRIVQEALTNVRKHAKAETARVSIEQRDGRITATIHDNGIGFTPGTKARGEFPRFGLTTMRERAESVGGTLDISSNPGGGTTVRVELPVMAAEPGA